MTRLFAVLALLWVCGPVGTARASVPVARLVAGQVLATDSVRMETFKLLTQGDIQGAIDHWVLISGREAPKWLMATKVAFDASRQVVGVCQEGARSIYFTFAQLGGKPELVELKTRADYVVFKMANGQDLPVSRTGYHMLVRMGGRAYDAFTGAAGMPWSEYMSRLGARAGFTEKIVESIP